MSDETPIEASAPPAAEAPVETGTPSEQIESQLQALRREKEELEAYRENARRMVTHDGAWSEDYEKAARHLMSDAGYEPESIDSWVEWQKTQLEDGTTSTPEEVSAPAIAPKDPPVSAPNNDQSDYIKKLEARLNDLENKAGDTQVQVLQRHLEDTLDRTFQQHDAVTGLLGKIQRFSGESASEHEKRTAILREDIKKETLEAVRRKTAAGGKFDPSWFDVEAEKAANSVVAKLRAVIGDPDRLMRAPETVTGEDSIRREGPVEDPKWKSGMGPADAQSMVKDFSTDKLLEGLDELVKQPGSRA